MANLNEVRLIGRLTRVPENRVTTGGHNVCKMGLASGRKYKGADGIMKEETTFVDIECWGNLAEICGKYLTKGSLVFIGGRLKLDQWQDRETGANRSKLKVVADNVQFLDNRNNQQQNEYESTRSVAEQSYPPVTNQEWDYQAPTGDDPPF